MINYNKVIETGKNIGHLFRRPGVIRVQTNQPHLAMTAKDGRTVVDLLNPHGALLKTVTLEVPLAEVSVGTARAALGC